MFGQRGHGQPPGEQRAVHAAAVQQQQRLTAAKCVSADLQPVDGQPEGFNLSGDGWVHANTSRMTLARFFGARQTEEHSKNSSARPPLWYNLLMRNRRRLFLALLLAWMLPALACNLPSRARMAVSVTGTPGSISLATEPAAATPTPYIQLQPPLATALVQAHPLFPDSEIVNSPAAVGF